MTDVGTADTRSGLLDTSHPDSRATGAFTSTLWRSSADIYDEILSLPFLADLKSGTLSEDAFAYYIVQDGYYIRSYLRNLALLASRAPEDWVFEMLVSQMAGSIGAEVGLSDVLLGSLDSHWASERPDPSPTGVAYMSWITANCHEGSFLEGLVSVLPCYWIYARVGAHLEEYGSTHPVYSRWIASYAEVDFEQTVVETLRCVDRLAETASDSLLARCVDLYRKGSNYEWMFWNSAYIQESWPHV